MKQSKGSRMSGKVFSFLFNFKFLFVVLFSVVVVSLLSSVSYAGVKYHSLGDDATKIYVKEIKELPLDYKNYDWFWDKRTGYILGQPKDLNSGRLYQYIDPYTYKVFFRTDDGGILFTPDKKYMLYYRENYNVEIYDLATMKKEIYNIKGIEEKFNKTYDKYEFDELYDRYHIIGLEQTGKDEYWISLGDVRTGKVERVCRIKGYEKFNFIKFMDKNNIFYEVKIKKGSKEEKRLYRLSLGGCKEKLIIRGYYDIGEVYQGIYRNYRGEIRIPFVDYEKGGIMDRDGRVIYIFKPGGDSTKDLCGAEDMEGDVWISPDDKLFLEVFGEIDTSSDDEYWIEGGKRCVLIEDWRGKRTKLNLGLGDKEVPDEIYWHPMGDRLIMKYKGKISIVILGRRR